MPPRDVCSLNIEVPWWVYSLEDTWIEKVMKDSWGPFFGRRSEDGRRGEVIISFLFFFFHCFKAIPKWKFQNISQGMIWTDYALALACRSFANCPDYKWPLRDIMWNEIAYYSGTQRFLQDILVLKKTGTSQDLLNMFWNYRFLTVWKKPICTYQGSLIA